MSTIKNNWLILFVVCVAVLFLLVAWMFLRSEVRQDIVPPASDPLAELGSSIGTVNQSVAQQISSVPSALAKELEATRIYFMLTAKNDLHAQSFVFENGSFSEPQAPEVNQYDHYYSYSSDGNKATFFAVPEKDYTYPDTWGAQAKLYAVDASGPDDLAFPVLNDTSIIDQTHIPHKQHADISNAGEVLFNGWEPERMPGVEPAEDWSIYAVVDGEAQFLTHGFMPKWLNDSEFIFLKNDGLYRATKDLSSIQMIGTSSEAIVLSNNRFDISDDGSLLVWTQPYLPQVYVYRLTEDALELERSILAKSFWALFSPSSNYLALQTIDLYAGGKEEDPQAKIEFYDMTTFEKVPELELRFNDFNQLYMFMTDWVVK